MLGPALAPGYVLTYDMVWVPRLAMRADFLGLGTALPRAVPSDAVVAALDVLLPGMLLQKLVLAGALLGAAIGSLRLVGPGLAARMVATSVVIWNPFVAERLWLGQWTLLVGYAALPWLADAAIRARRERAVPPLLLVLLPVASLSANAGIVSGLVVLALGVARGRSARTSLLLVVAVLAANAPWVVAGLLHAPIAEGGGSTRFFALHGDGLPAPLAALSLGGIWNADVVPTTRTGLVLPLVTCLAVLLAALLGFRRTARRLGRRTTAGLVACWVVGYALALLTWVAPSAVDWSAGHVPGGGLLRDGTRSLALCVPLLVVLAGDAVDAVAERGREAGLGVLVAVVAAVAPLALLPDAAWGVGGHLHAVRYPDDWARARDVIAAAPPRGDLLVLPFSSYRAPAWNDGRIVLDPLGRYLQPDFVVSDRLAVSGTVLPGEDTRGPRVADALRDRDPAAAARSLGRLGIGMVAIEKDAVAPAGATPEPAGTVAFDGPTLRLVRIDAPVTVRDRPAGWVVALAAAWAAYVMLLLVGLGRPVRTGLGIAERRGPE